MTLSEAFSNFKNSAKRLEILQEFFIYGSELDQFINFCEGKKVEEFDDFKKWNKLISQSTKQGKTIERVRVIENPLSSYLKFEIECGYIVSQAYGQEVCFVSSENYKKLNIDNIKNEFWIFDDVIIFEMIYNNKGEFVESKQVFGEKYLQLYNKLKSKSVSLENVVKQIRSNKTIVNI